MLDEMGGGNGRMIFVFTGGMMVHACVFDRVTGARLPSCQAGGAYREKRDILYWTNWEGQAVSE